MASTDPATQGYVDAAVATVNQSLQAVSGHVDALATNVDALNTSLAALTDHLNEVTGVDASQLATLFAEVAPAVAKVNEMYQRIMGPQTNV